jgi:FPC/CPF motif-containing protein YcgG
VKNLKDLLITDAPIPEWGRSVFSSFVEGMLSPSPAFPCIFGVNGLKTDQLRFCFVESKSPEALVMLVRALQKFLPQAKSFGGNTSLVAFFKPEESAKSVEDYEVAFWKIFGVFESKRPSALAGKHAKASRPFLVGVLFLRRACFCRRQHPGSLSKKKPMEQKFHAYFPAKVGF